MYIYMYIYIYIYIYVVRQLRVKPLKIVEHLPNKYFHLTNFSGAEHKEILITEVEVSVPSLKCKSAVMLWGRASSSGF